jgi:hypothetical protein
MQKVYLLLRNNQQTGPYTFEELLQLQLKPHDLIWVEGKSYGWRYPAEVESLKPYMTAAHIPQNETEHIHSKTVDTPSVTTANSKKVFVSMPINVQLKNKENAAPVDPIEQKAEELRKKAQAYIPSHPEEIKTNYNRNLNEAEEDYTKWIYERKKKKSGVPKKTVAIASVGVLILLTGWWVKGQFFSDSSITHTVNAIQQNKLPVDEESTSNNALVTEEENNPEKKPNPKIEKIKKEKPEVSIEKVIVQKETPASETVSSKNEQVIEQITESNSEERKNESAVEVPEKKKTLKEKLGDLFKKKKENLPEEEPKVTENTSGERRATRREDASSSVSVTDVSDLVDLKTNKIADSWMMGVKNVKLTLYNKSDLTINAAKVEVSYYSDQNNLLEKKTISYSNIAPQKSQTVTIPDNRLADHIDYKVLSATGVENAYATR